MYTSYYGFSARPFQLSPDPRFLFRSSGHKRALAYLQYGLSQSEGFIVVTGPIGTGKTLLVKSLFTELNEDEILAAQLVTTQLAEDDLLRMVVAAFGLPHENLNKASLIRHLEIFLKDCAAQGKRVLLIVDEAQNLPPRSLEELRMISNFQISNKPLLQSFLLGQEEFRATLLAPEMEQLRQRVIASCQLNPLTYQETCDYIIHRLRLVGWDDKPHITEGAYSAIHQQSRGIPRRVNILCDRLLLYGFLEELQEFSETNVEEVSRELFQETGDSRQTDVLSDASNEATRFRDLLEKRIATLEQAMEALVQFPEWQDIQMERLERRLMELEPAVKKLRQEVLNLGEQVKEIHKNKKDNGPRRMKTVLP